MKKAFLLMTTAVLMTLAACSGERKNRVGDSVGVDTAATDTSAVATDRIRNDQMTVDTNMDASGGKLKTGTPKQ